MARHWFTAPQSFCATMLDCSRPLSNCRSPGSHEPPERLRMAGEDIAEARGVWRRDCRYAGATIGLEPFQKTSPAERSPFAGTRICQALLPSLKARVKVVILTGFCYVHFYMDEKTKQELQQEILATYEDEINKYKKVEDRIEWQYTFVSEVLQRAVCQTLGKIRGLTVYLIRRTKVGIVTILILSPLIGCELFEGKAASPHVLDQELPAPFWNLDVDAGGTSASSQQVGWSGNVMSVCLDWNPRPQQSMEYATDPFHTIYEILPIT